MKDKKIRVLLGKLGLDTHDRGIRVVASAIRDAGMELIYAGVFQSEEAIYQTAIEEDVDVVGLSFLCGGHIGWMERVLGYFKGKDEKGKAFFVGGIIPKDDIPILKSMGVKAVFGPGTDVDVIVNTIQKAASSRT